MVPPRRSALSLTVAVLLLLPLLSLGEVLPLPCTGGVRCCVHGRPGEAPVGTAAGGILRRPVTLRWGGHPALIQPSERLAGPDPNKAVGNKFLQTMQQRATATKDDFDPTSVAEFMCSLAKLDVAPDASTTQALLQRATATAEEFDPTSLSSFL
ncbi:hypothetical protein T484DRAFT_2986853 [Baffinella frigidus]|nr:hypothetical protein T484DRAFT_2986853 [Cryptophyta sp. CCMP2293]